MKNILNTFDKIYIINLARASDRRKRIKRIFSKYDLEITFVEGVDGRDMPMEFFEKHPYLNTYLQEDRPLSKGEWATALSHLNTLKQLIDNNLDNALIFEDDVSISDDGFKKFAESLKYTPPNWDLIYFGYFLGNTGKKLPFKTWLLSYTYSWAKELLVDGGLGPNRSSLGLRKRFARQYNNYFSYAGYHYGLHAYAVSRRLAEIVFAKWVPTHRRSDYLMGIICAEEHEAKCFISNTPYFNQNRDEFPPDVEGRILDQKGLYLNE